MLDADLVNRGSDAYFIAIIVSFYLTDPIAAAQFDWLTDGSG